MHVAANQLHVELQRELDELGGRSLRRSLHVVEAAGRTVRMEDGAELINLAGNDYLGLGGHPRLKRAAIDAIERYGTTSGSSRLVAGTFELHAQIEREFAAFKHAEAAVLLPTGYMANLAVLTSLAGPGDLVCVDKLSHASLIDAARLSGADVRSYPHLQTAKLVRLLEKHRRPGLGPAERVGVGPGLHGHDGHPTRPGRPGSTRKSPDQGPAYRNPRRFIVTDSVFSMDGDTADLHQLRDIAEHFEATLIVDEAHGTGVLGETGAGLCEALGIMDPTIIVVSTASKALGGLGGIVTGPKVIIDTLIQRARSLIYTTAVPPAQAAAIGEAVRMIRDEPHRRQRLMELSARVRARLAECGWPLPQAEVDAGVGVAFATPIIPLIVGEADKALQLAEHLRHAGMLAVAIRPPTVPPGAARVRVSLRADLRDDDVERLLDTVLRWRA